MSGAGSQLHFRGALALPNDNEPSLIVDLRVDDEVVVITQDSEQLGSWPVEQVDAERLNGQKFRLLLGDDEVIFHARDRLGFAYNGLNAIQEAKERLAHRRSRWWFEKLVDANAAAPSPSDWISEKLASLRKAVERVAVAPPQREVEQPPPRRPRATSTTLEQPPHSSPTRSRTTSRPAPEPERADEPAAHQDSAPDLESGEIDEPWAIPPSPAGTAAPEKGGKQRDRPAVHRNDGGTDDPWAMVADAVLRRDDPPGSGAATPRSRRRRTKRDHIHEYEETRLPGGLVRRVCSCGEVVIRSID